MKFFRNEVIFMLKKCIVITISSIIILFAIIALSYEDALSLTTEVNRILAVMIITASYVMIAITKISDMDKSPISSTKILALSKLANIFLNLNNVIWIVLIIAGIFVYKLDSLFIIYKYFFPNITVVLFMIFVIVSVLKDKSTY
jgi:hypothetical protein